MRFHKIILNFHQGTSSFNFNTQMYLPAAKRPSGNCSCCVNLLMMVNIPNRIEKTPFTHFNHSNFSFAGDRTLDLFAWPPTIRCQCGAVVRFSTTQIRRQTSLTLFLVTFWPCVGVVFITLSQGAASADDVIWCCCCIFIDLRCQVLSFFFVYFYFIALHEIKSRRCFTLALSTTFAEGFLWVASSSMFFFSPFCFRLVLSLFYLFYDHFKRLCGWHDADATIV